MTASHSSVLYSSSLCLVCFGSVPPRKLANEWKKEKQNFSSWTVLWVAHFVNNSSGMCSVGATLFYPVSSLWLQERLAHILKIDLDQISRWRWSGSVANEYLTSPRSIKDLECTYIRPNPIESHLAFSNGLAFNNWFESSKEKEESGFGPVLFTSRSSSPMALLPLDL